MLVVFVSATDEVANFLVDPWETIRVVSFMYWDAGVSALLEFGDKLVPQNLDICSTKIWTVEFPHSFSWSQAAFL